MKTGMLWEHVTLKNRLRQQLAFQSSGGGRKQQQQSEVLLHFLWSPLYEIIYIKSNSRLNLRRKKCHLQTSRKSRNFEVARSESTAMPVHSPDHRPPALFPEGAKFSGNSQPLRFGKEHSISCSLAPGMYVGIGAGKKGTHSQPGFISRTPGHGHFPFTRNPNRSHQSLQAPTRLPCRVPRSSKRTTRDLPSKGGPQSALPTSCAEQQPRTTSAVAAPGSASARGDQL